MKSNSCIYIFCFSMLVHRHQCDCSRVCFVSDQATHVIEPIDRSGGRRGRIGAAIARQQEHGAVAKLCLHLAIAQPEQRRSLRSLTMLCCQPSAIVATLVVVWRRHCIASRLEIVSKVLYQFHLIAQNHVSILSALIQSIANLFSHFRWM
jgi:hypothetical protein